jgi:hypothetical protein
VARDVIYALFCSSCIVLTINRSSRDISGRTNKFTNPWNAISFFVYLVLLTAACILTEYGGQSPQVKKKK